MPTELAQGPWGPMVSGNVTGGLLGRCLERIAGDSEFQPARLTVDLFGPTRLEPMRTTTRLVRDSHRIRVGDAVLKQGDSVVARASAVFLRRGEEPAQEVWSTPITMPDRNPLLRSVGRSPFDIETVGWGRPVGSEAGVDPVVGPKFAWVREIRPLVDGESVTPFVRAAMAADVTNPLAHWGTGGMQFINVDYTLSLTRLPVGDHVGLAAVTHYSHEGVATGTATLFDEVGPVGSAMSTSITDGRFRPSSAVAGLDVHGNESGLPARDKTASC